MGRNEDGPESRYYTFCLIFLRRDENIAESAEVLDFGRGYRIDVSEENVERGRRLGKVDVWRLMGGVVGLRERQHVPEDGRSDG